MTHDRPDDEEAFYEVEAHPTGVILRRTARRYRDKAEIPESFSHIDQHLRGVEVSSGALLCDLRRVVGRNDPEFEATIVPLRRALLRRFARVAFIVRTTIGKLQVERYLAADGEDARVFNDEAAAMQWFEQ